METINPKSMFTKGQNAYSIALLSYKDDETEKIITHTISKVGRSFVYDEKETKYHYSKYRQKICIKTQKRNKKADRIFIRTL